MSEPGITDTPACWNFEGFGSSHDEAETCCVCNGTGFTDTYEREWLTFRGQRWFVADVQDDETHLHLTVVLDPPPEKTPVRKRTKMLGRRRVSGWWQA